MYLRLSPAAAKLPGFPDRADGPWPPGRSTHQACTPVVHPRHAPSSVGSLRVRLMHEASVSRKKGDTTKLKSPASGRPVLGPSTGTNDASSPPHHAPPAPPDVLPALRAAVARAGPRPRAGPEKRAPDQSGRVRPHVLTPCRSLRRADEEEWRSASSSPHGAPRALPRLRLRGGTQRNHGPRSPRPATAEARARSDGRRERACPPAGDVPSRPRRRPRLLHAPDGRAGRHGRPSTIAHAPNHAGRWRHTTTKQLCVPGHLSRQPLGPGQ